MKKYEIVCHGCCGTFHKTNENFNPDVICNGSMLALKQSFKDAGWGSFPEYESTEFGDICCPSCGTPYVNDRGRLIADRMQELPGELVEEIAEEVVEVVDEDIPWPEEVEDQEDQEEVVDEEPVSDKVNCPVCDDKFSPKGIANHIRAKHPDYKPE